MSDISAVAARYNGADLEFYDKASGNTVFALRANQVVDLSGGTIKSGLQITLTAAQLKALHGTPITVVAAAGAGTLINVTEILYEFKYGTIAMTTSAGVINLYWGSSAGQAVGTNGIAAAIIKGTASTMVGDVPVIPATTAGVVVANMLNQPVVIQNPSVTEYAAGDSTLVITVNYKVLSGF